MKYTPSISFDRAADFYDATRAMPEDIAEKTTEAVLDELASVEARRLLEIGVGTGRVARPLMERGVHVTGIDISPRMMARLREQLTPAHTPPDLLLADATRMPFRDSTFPAVLFVHVLHLIPNWRQAIAEIVGVLEADGIVLSHWDQTAGSPDWGIASVSSDWDVAFEWWRDELSRRGFRRRKRAGIREISRAFERAGATSTRRTVAEREEVTTVGEELEETRNRISSWSWEIPDDMFAELLPQHEKWALDYFGSADAKLKRTVEYNLQGWRFSTT
jgi:ubiquinone/menaquinone biosynthesis C-methylase UbiE